MGPGTHSHAMSAVLWQRGRLRRRVLACHEQLLLEVHPRTHLVLQLRGDRIGWVAYEIRGECMDNTACQVRFCGKCIGTMAYHMTVCQVLGCLGGGGHAGCSHAGRYIVKRLPQLPVGLPEQVCICRKPRIRAGGQEGRATSRSGRRFITSLLPTRVGLAAPATDMPVAGAPPPPPAPPAPLAPPAPPSILSGWPNLSSTAPPDDGICGGARHDRQVVVMTRGMDEK